MKMKRDYKLYIKDILNSVLKTEEFIGDMSYRDFIEDDKTSSAVVRKLEIIGEASKNIPKEIRMKYKEVPWSDMAKMRDKITHFYFGVDYEIVWKVIKERLPTLKQQIQKLLKEVEG
jgi:uncharacterized protein with HEPN domain